MSANESIPNIINGRYQVLTLIGRGGMGMVYHVRDRLTDKTVALKQVFAVQTTVARKLALAREFQTLASLHHPNIINVLDYGFDAEQRPFFTMGFLQNAQTILAAGAALPLAGKLQLSEQLLLGLTYLRRRGVFHRDLKPENVLVSNGVVRILDFGLASSPSGVSAAVGGSALYAAPEVWEQVPYTFAADLYAVGTILCELISGHHPFGPLDPNFIDRVLDSEPDLTGVPSVLVPLLHQLLAKQPLHRPQTPEAVLLVLAKATNRPLLTETPAIRESYLQAATFVGRDHELNQIKQALEHTRQGVGSAWLIGGESGVGKSRLLEEARILALINGFQVLRGQAVEVGGLPYQAWRWPIRQLLLNYTISPLEASVIKELVPDIGHLLNQNIPDAPDLPGEAGRQRLSLTIVELLKRQSSPTVLLLEDVNWSSESLPILNLISASIAKFPLLILASYSHDKSPGLSSALPHLTLLMLKRLTRSETSLLSYSMLGEIGTQPQVIEFLQRETEGNLFFLVEAVRALAEQSGGLDQIGISTLPETITTGGVQRTIQYRLNQVPSSGQRLLRLAAILGRQLDLVILSILETEKKPDDWLTACANAAVFEWTDGHWRFTHDKLREILLASLPLAEKTSLHAEVASALETVYAIEPAYAEKIAYHWEQAQQFTRAVPYSIQAAESLISITADFKRAENLIERVLPHADAEPKTALLLLYGKAADRRGQFEIAIQRYRAALEHIGENTTRKIEALNNLSEVQWRCSQLPEAQHNASQALELARQYNLPSGLARSLFNLGIVAGVTTHAHEAKSYFTQALEIYRALGNRSWIARVLNSLSIPARYEGAYDQAHEFIQEALILNHEIGDRWGTASAHLNLAIVTNLAGNFPVALPYFKEAELTFRQIGERLGVAMCQIGLGNAYNNWNEPYKAKPYFLQALPALNELKDRRGIGIGHYGLGVTEALLGSTTQARDYLEQATQMFEQLRLRAWSVETQAELTLVLIQLNELENAQKMLSATIQTSLELAQAPATFHALKAATYYAVTNGQFHSSARWLKVLRRFENKLPKELQRLQELTTKLQVALGDQQFNELCRQGSVMDKETALQQASQMFTA